MPRRLRRLASAVSALPAEPTANTVGVDACRKQLALSGWLQVGLTVLEVNWRGPQLTFDGLASPRRRSRSPVGSRVPLREMAQDIERQAPNIGILILSRTSKA